ncbi:hypothetical protein [Gulosibacter molinativorax]|nr:hypothetical protein [Gulosibacter molinativorax]QUY61899.1 Hypotetical protein [Gulosibacter molinativorax]
MRPYLDATGNNEKRALALYQWHLELTSAVQSVLGVTEVVLRNAMDKELQSWNTKETGGRRSWLLEEPAAPLRSLSANKRKRALEAATREAERRNSNHRRYGETVSHDDVLAQLMFGIWKDLLPNHQPGAGNSTDNSNRARLWREALTYAFPNEEDPDGEITFWRVARLHQLRNRVSHMEPLLNIDVQDEVKKAFQLVRSIDTEVANWVTGGSKVSEVLNRRPSQR